MMNPEELKELQINLSIALKAEKEANELVEKAQTAYDEKLADFKIEHAEIVEALDGAKEQKLVYKKAAAKFKATATAELNIQFIDDLPEGFVQKNGKSVSFDAKEMKLAAIAHFHHLLILDVKEADMMILNAVENPKEQEKAFVVSSQVADFVDAAVQRVPLPNISNATLLKLDN